MAKKRDYNAAEVEAMRKAGFITPREAAERAKVSLSRVYRAIKGKHVPVKAGDNAWNQYVKADAWLKFIKARQQELAQQLGL